LPPYAFLYAFRNSWFFGYFEPFADGLQLTA
jgi:hypothetical protein